MSSDMEKYMKTELEIASPACSRRGEGGSDEPTAPGTSDGEAVTSDEHKVGRSLVAGELGSALHNRVGGATTARSHPICSSPI